MELSTTSPSLEAELTSIAENTEPGRTARIAVRHWGWDGRGGATLEATGREFHGITRERVRQLCERLSRRLRESGATTPAPALDAALMFAAGATPTTAHALARLLAGAVTMIFFTYAFVNMGMVSGILPVVGVPLPFISYGGTAMVTLGLALGILMSIANSKRLVQS